MYTCVKVWRPSGLLCKKTKKLKLCVDNSKKICATYNCSPGARGLQ